MSSDPLELIEISTDVELAFPGLKIAYLVAEGTQVVPTPPRQKKRARALEREMRAGYDSEEILANPTIAAWIALYQAMDLDVAEVRPAQLELALSVLRGRDIPKINNIVDAANMAAIDSKCPVGAFDLDHLSAPVMLRFSSAGESYVPLLCSEPETIPRGEIVYADGEGIFSRYSKDADRTKITAESHRVLYVIDGAPSVDQTVLLLALDGLSALLRDVAGESVTIQTGYVEAQMRGVRPR